MAYDSIKVANEFLRLGQEATPPQPLTPLQLMKLVYIAHGWHLAWHDKPLLRKSPEAWFYGPGVPVLYPRIRGFGGDQVPFPIGGETDNAPIDEAARETIRRVFDRYGRYSGAQLSSLTHQPYTPWWQVWQRYKRNAPIPDEVIQSHYLGLDRQSSKDGRDRSSAAA